MMKSLAFLSVLMGVTAILVMGCSNPESDLLDAIYNDDAEAVKRAIKKGADPNKEMVTQESGPIKISGKPLGIAAGKKSSAAFIALLESGADVEGVMDEFGAVFFAAQCDLPECVVAALEKGGDPSELRGQSIKDSSLHVAAKNGNMRVVEILLTHGADPQSKDSNGQTPSDVAATPAIAEKIRAAIPQ